MSRIKVVPKATPNADGEWIEVPVELVASWRWQHIESIVAPHIPPDHFVVQIECGPRPLSLC